MNSIDVQLTIHPNCKLSAKYISDFIDNNDKDENNYKIVEYLNYKGQFMPESVILKDDIGDTTFALLKDGTYTYYRFHIPHLYYLAVESETSDNVIHYNKICLKKQLYYYDGQFYFCDTDDIIESLSLTLDEIFGKHLDTILAKSIKVSVDEIQSYIDIAIGSFYCKKIAFTYCNLINCFVSLQSKSVNNLCSQKCNENITDVENRDFLLSTIYVLDYLRDTNNFTEAQRILDNVIECWGICENLTNNTDCGCYA